MPSYAAADKLLTLAVTAGRAKLSFICKSVIFENKGKTRKIQRMKKKWQRKEQKWSKTRDEKIEKEDRIKHKIMNDKKN